MNSAVCKRKVDTRDKFLARISDAAVRKMKREVRLRLTTRDLGTRVANEFEVDGGIFEYYEL
jgi:hypothetical protein